MAKRIYLTAAVALTLLAACNGPSAPQPAPPPQPEPQTQAELPPPPLLGGPPGAPTNETLLGGPYATDDKPGPLTTFRRADGVEVTVMRPIPNPGDEPPVAQRHRGHDRAAGVEPQPHAAQAPVSQAPSPTRRVEALAPTQPVPPPKVVEHPRPAAPPVHPRTHIKPPASPQAVIPPPAAPARPSLVDRLSNDRIRTPGGETSPKSLLGLLLVLAAMVLLVAIARRIGRARDARDRARRAAARQAIAPETETPETPAKPPESEPQS